MNDNPAAEPDDDAALVDRVAAVVLACPAVADLSAGPFGVTRSYLSGRTVPGVRIDPDAADVHVVLTAGHTVGDLTVQVRAAVGPLVAVRRIDITVEDITGDEPSQDAGRAGHGEGAAPGERAPAVVPGADPGAAAQSLPRTAGQIQVQASALARGAR